MSTTNWSSSPLVRETAAAFLRRPGGALCWTRVALPEELQIHLKGLGTLELRPLGQEPWATSGRPTDAEAACEHFFLPAMGPGLLLVERRFARHLVGGLLGAPVSLGLASLSRIERGVLAGLLAAALARSGLGVIQVSPSSTDDVAPDVVAFAVRAKVGDETGAIWLCATLSAIHTCCEGVLKSLGKKHPAAVRLELARTNLLKSEALAVSAGDVVVFDETAALSSSSAWPMRLCYCGRQVSLDLAPDGGVRAAGEIAAPASLSIEARSRSRAEEVAVVAEIAHAAVTSSSVDEPADNARGDGILLRMDETDWAEGDLCDVADRFAVRIRRVLTD